MNPTTTRQTAEARREAILDAALAEFAHGGLEGTSTDAIARRAGISQPYVFRLFGTKKELFIAAVERCFAETHDIFLAAGAGKRGQEALEAMGQGYLTLLMDRDRLLLQLQAYAACGDPDVRAAVRAGYGELVQMVERLSGAAPDEVSRFFAKGMLLNVVTSMKLREDPEGWGTRLIDGCIG